MSPVEERIRDFINQHFLFEDDPQVVPVRDSLFGGGLLDSAHMVEVIVFLEKTFGISIPSTDIIPDNFDTIERMADYVRRAAGAEDRQSVGDRT